MRTHLILILAFLLAGLNFNYGQCLPEGIWFTSQAQIDAFPSNYPGCTMIEGDVWIEESVEGDIIHLDSLYAIISIGGSLNIWFDYALTSLKGLNSLTSIGGNLIIENTALTNLSGLDSLTSVGGYLFILSNSALTSLNGLEGLTYLESLGIEGNHALTSLSGLDSLTSIGGNLCIGACHGYHDGASPEGNNLLTSFSGLNSLTFIGGHLRIEANDQLVSLNGLESLTSIGEFLMIGDWHFPAPPSGDGSLTSLSGLENLISIGWWVAIRYNDSLTNLCGLKNIDYTTIEFLTLIENPNLSICSIQPICDYLENGGEAEILSNAPGCDSQQIVEGVCQNPKVEDPCQAVSVDDLMLDDAIQLFPNPSTGIIQITTPDNTEWNVSIRDAMGRTYIRSHKLVNGEVDLSTVPTGLYFLELNDGQHSITKRIIKQ